MIFQKMSVFQRDMPRAIQKKAYDKIPESCMVIGKILEEVKVDLMKELDVDAADEAIIDAITSRAFQRIRDEVSHPFRDEQMRLLKELEGETDEQ